MYRQSHGTPRLWNELGGTGASRSVYGQCSPHIFTHHPRTIRPVSIFGYRGEADETRTHGPTQGIRRSPAPPVCRHGHSFRRDKNFRNESAGPSRVFGWSARTDSNRVPCLTQIAFAPPLFRKCKHAINQ